MAKKPSISDYVRQLVNGEGLGQGVGYKPWYDARCTRTHGVSSQTFGIKTGRIHHGLSANEKNFFYLIEFDPLVIDIREQFPLFPLSLSMRMSEELGIKHPVIPYTQVPSVVTTDFLITYLKNDEPHYAAFSVKPKEGLAKIRDLEKQELERVWWEQIGVPWKIFINRDIDKLVANNIRWISQPLRDGRSKPLELINAILNSVEPGAYELAYLFCSLSKALNISEDEASELFKIAVWRHLIKIDLEMDILNDGMINILSINSVSADEVKYGNFDR